MRTVSEETNVCKNIKALRREMGWTQEELARKVGYTDKSIISRIEDCLIDLPLSKVFAFADTFGVSVESLFEVASTTKADNDVVANKEEKKWMHIKEFHSLHIDFDKDIFLLNGEKIYGITSLTLRADDHAKWVLETNEYKRYVPSNPKYAREKNY